MEKIATENLFLLEFLVDSVKLDPNCDCAVGEGERCVSFQFLDNAPLDVCEEEFTPYSKQQQIEKDSVKSGKSCLFSLSPEQAKAALTKFDIYVTIWKKMPAGWLPERVEIGEALISIANLFTELIKSVESSDGSTPTAKTLKDSFDINNAKKLIGKIGVYIRMSCFGKLIVTQFQMNLEDKSVLFRDKEGKSLYKYKKAGKGRKGKSEDDTARPPSTDNYRPRCPYPPVGNFNMAGNFNPSQCPTVPCAMFPPPGMGGAARPFTPNMLDQQMGQFNQDPYNQTSPCQECRTVPNAPCVQMQGRTMGMGANMGMGPNMGMGMATNMAMGGVTPCIECGNIPNAPCIRPQSGMGRTRGATPCVECGNLPNAPCLSQGANPYSNPNMGNTPFPYMSQGVYPYSSTNVRTPCLECAGLENPPCGPQSEADANYQEIGASMGGNTLTIRVHKDRNKVEQIDPNAPPVEETKGDAKCCCTPGQMGKKSKNNQERTLNMRPGIQQGNQDLPFSFKMGKSGNGGEGNVVVNPPISTAPDGTKFTEFSDPNKELFILRVGKKSEGIDKKQNLELELCTPRGKVM